MPRITFQKETVTELQRQLHEAYALGDVRLVRRIAVELREFERILADHQRDLLEVWETEKRKRDDRTSQD